MSARFEPNYILNISSLRLMIDRKKHKKYWMLAENQLSPACVQIKCFRKFLNKSASRKNLVLEWGIHKK